MGTGAGAAGSTQHRWGSALQEDGMLSKKGPTGLDGGRGASWRWQNRKPKALQGGRLQRKPSQEHRAGGGGDRVP